jgi:hypothetical protein
MTIAKEAPGANTTSIDDLAARSTGVRQAAAFEDSRGYLSDIDRLDRDIKRRDSNYTTPQSVNLRYSNGRPLWLH